MDTVLQFSGGKDSLACLYLLEPRWKEIEVVWVNTGAAFPEVEALMQLVAAKVPHFREVRSIQPFNQGYPVDVLPIRATSAGAAFEGYEGPIFQSRYSCCAAALWAPMQQAMQGVKTIIRGQKRCDAKKTPIRSGQVVEGICYEFPLEDWSDAEVLAYLEERGVLPAHYREISCGLDCWNCTAYLEEDRLHYLARHHPRKYNQVRAVLDEWQRAVNAGLEPAREPQ